MTHREVIYSGAAQVLFTLQEGVGPQRALDLDPASGVANPPQRRAAYESAIEVQLDAVCHLLCGCECLIDSECEVGRGRGMFLLCSKRQHSAAARMHAVCRTTLLSGAPPACSRRRKRSKCFPAAWAGVLTNVGGTLDHKVAPWSFYDYKGPNKIALIVCCVPVFRA